MSDETSAGELKGKRLTLHVTYDEPLWTWAVKSYGEGVGGYWREEDVAGGQRVSRKLATDDGLAWLANYEKRVQRTRTVIARAKQAAGIDDS